jgi:hypothetical protein
MTISELKRAMDRRFDRLERTKVDKAEFRRAITTLRTDLKRVERTKVDKAEFRRAITRLRTELHGEIVTSAAETRRYMDATGDHLRLSLRDEIASSAAETRCHFDVVAEAIRDDIRIFAEALTSCSDRLDKHDRRIGALERRSM